ncbi:glycoside hydrolase [Pseudovirgaria hyperparasitica]|uniref:non-reducing end alpha-L-arabinofuranosidase n=1 Tax=Pseudovirgaria hyperparasitica TaxID=470096 RepID=A0A6A6VVE6_9PEZI|nr:glycoside hydrolase [Pseudovirgaria hyperparasitica]KAF2753237.1 glycoside hydrolase [Pseudovirgaria hyperparasitica]
MLSSLLLAAAGLLVKPTYSISLEVSTSGGNSSGALPVGMMFEDVNHGGDGGIHGQLLGDNAFQGTNASLFRYASIGNATLSIDDTNPLTSAIVRSLKVDVPEDASGEVGFSNDGFWGIKLPQGTYSTFFWMSGDYEGDVTVKLVPKTGSGTEFGSTTLAIKKSSKWTKYEAKFDVKAAPNGNNVWALTFDGSKTAGSTLYFTLMSLYLPTYLDKENGLKPELAQPLADIKGRFLRFPGGNNLEGDTIDGRLRWNQTIGPLEDRPGRQDVWSYANTDAIGTLEYLEWAEYMNLEPMMDIFAGLALKGETVTGDALEPYIEDALAQIEYAVGDSSTHWGAIRASHGRTEPFALKYVEIGNEDNLSNGCASYVERFQRFYDAIHAAHPSITLIASTADLNCLPKDLPGDAWLDYHRYDRPDAFVEAFSFFDNIPRTNKYIINEFAAIYHNNGTRATYPTMRSAVAEAIYMMGAQRNSDLVQGLAYAPLIAHLAAVDLYNAWTPSLLSFRNDPPVTILSTSYFVQQMFAQASDPTDRYVDVVADGPLGPTVFWVASVSSGGQGVVKGANYAGVGTALRVRFAGGVEGTKRARVVVLSGDAEARNDEVDPGAVRPVEGVVEEGAEGWFEVEMPAWSVVVLVAE